MRLGEFIKLLVQPGHEIAAAAEVGNIPISHQAVPGTFKVVLDHRTMISFCDLFPHHTEIPENFFKLMPDRLFIIRDLRESVYIAGRGMDINDVRLKCRQFRFSEHHVLPVIVVFGFVKLRFDSLIQEKKIQYRVNLSGGGASEDGDLFMEPLHVSCQQLSADLFFRAQYQL